MPPCQAICRGIKENSDGSGGRDEIIINTAYVCVRGWFQFDCLLFKEKKVLERVCLYINASGVHLKVSLLEITLYIKIVSCLSVSMLQLQLRRQSGRATFTLALAAIK